MDGPPVIVFSCARLVYEAAFEHVNEVRHEMLEDADLSEAMGIFCGTCGAWWRAPYPKSMQEWPPGLVEDLGWGTGVRLGDRRTYLRHLVYDGLEADRLKPLRRRSAWARILKPAI
jgi:hypothetical protein